MSYLYVKLVFEIIVLRDPGDLGLDAFVGAVATCLDLDEQFNLAWCGDDVLVFHWLEFLDVHFITAVSSAKKPHHCHSSFQICRSNLKVEA